MATKRQKKKKAKQQAVSRQAIKQAKRIARERKKTRISEKQLQIERIKALERQLQSEGYAIKPIKTKGKTAAELSKIKISEERKKYQKEQSYKDLDMLIELNFIAHVTEVFSRNPPLLAVIKNWYRITKQRLGQEDFLKMLDTSYSMGLWPSWESVSDSTKLTGSLSAMLSVMDLGRGNVEDIMEEAEQFWEVYY